MFWKIITKSALNNDGSFNLANKLITVFSRTEEKLRLRRVRSSIKFYQEKLADLINQMADQGQIGFRTTLVKADHAGYTWLPAERIAGKLLRTYFNYQPDWSTATGLDICRDYQTVIRKYRSQEKLPLPDRLGKSWLWQKLLLWSSSLITTGLISRAEIAKIAADFDYLICQKDLCFEYVHGNIIGDRIFVAYNGTLYLLGLNIVPRPDGVNYDILRFFDWFFLKDPNHQRNSHLIRNWLNSFMGQPDREKLKLIMAFRCIGILGWDIIHCGDKGMGSLAEKQKYLLRFIRRHY